MNEFIIPILLSFLISLEQLSYTRERNLKNSNSISNSIIAIYVAIAALGDTILLFEKITHQNFDISYPILTLSIAMNNIVCHFFLN